MKTRTENTWRFKLKQRVASDCGSYKGTILRRKVGMGPQDEYEVKWDNYCGPYRSVSEGTTWHVESKLRVYESSFKIGDEVVCRNVPKGYHISFHACEGKIMTVRKIQGMKGDLIYCDIPDKGCWAARDLEKLSTRTLTTTSRNAQKNFSLDCTCPIHLISLGCPRVTGGKCRDR